MQSIQQLPPGSTFAQDFRIERTLGVGGMGAVYEATLKESGKRVALKLMHPSALGDAKLRQRFAQEARVGAWIDSPYIVDVLGAGLADGVPWIAMELLKGKTLASKIQRYLPAQGLPHDEAWLVLAQVCRGLIAAHDKNVVHRDLKPENVFVTAHPRADAPFTVKILDFGIARYIDPTTPGSNRTAAIGTPLWMAPEQNSVTEITPAADLWALGLLCFRMFTGRFYWLSANEPELNLGWLFQELVSEPLVPASQRAARLGCEALLPPGLDPILARCIARDPRQRFAHARDFAEAVVAIAPPYFQPFDGSPSLPPAASARASAAPPPPTLVAAPPGPAPTLVAAPSGPAPTLVAPPPAPALQPQTAASPLRLPHLVGAVTLIAVIVAVIALLSAGSADDRTTPASDRTAPAESPRPNPSTRPTPGIAPMPGPGSPGPLPVDPALRTPK